MLSLSSVALSLILVAAPAKKTVSVLYFDNDTGDATYDHLGKGLADMMITDLSQVPGLAIVEREKLEALVKELKLQRSKFFDPATATKIGKGLGARYAVTGALVAAEPELRIDIRLIDVGTGAILKADKVRGPKDKFFDLQAALVQRFADGLVGRLTRAEEAKVARSLAANKVSDPKAVNGYGRALDLKDKGNAQAASEAMQGVVVSEPTFALARDRYLAIMRELAAARAARGKIFSETQTQLLASVERRLPELERLRNVARPETCAAVHTYLRLKSQVLLQMIGKAVGDGAPFATFQPALEAYLATTEELYRHAAESAEQRRKANLLGTAEKWDTEYLDPDDAALAETGRLELGTYPSEPHQLLAEAASVLILGSCQSCGTVTPNPFAPKEQLCLFKLDKSYAPRVEQLLERAQAEAKLSDKRRKQEHGIVAGILYASYFVLRQRPADAVSKLQPLLTEYPTSPLYGSVERLINSILAGEQKDGGSLTCHAF